MALLITTATSTPPPLACLRNKRFNATMQRARSINVLPTKRQPLRSNDSRLLPHWQMSGDNCAG